MLLASCSKIQWGLEYPTKEYLIPKRFEVPIYNGSVLEWLVIAIAMDLIIRKPNHWKSEQNGRNFVPISKGFEHHWKTKQRVTIVILNAFGIPAPTVLCKDLLSQLASSLFSNESRRARDTFWRWSLRNWLSYLWVTFGDSWSFATSGPEIIDILFKGLVLTVIYNL